MTSIPLLCNICPKQPDFSDISHLLTHVASKGHLAQELKAKVRGRQDASIREKLDAYDRWYEKHQIEKLLSQRLILKESKDASTTSRAKRSLHSPAAGTSKNVRPRRKRVKSSDQVAKASPVKSEEPAIDPQLSGYPPSSPSPFLNLPEYGDLQQHGQAYNHRFYVPRMCEDQEDRSIRRAAIASTPSKIPSGQKSLQGPGPDTDSENDYFNTFIRSPTMTAYPDPSELLAPSLALSPPSTVEQLGKRAMSTPDPKDRHIERAESIQPPILKGVKWPGMSIFDSASLEAQRLRNQKKDGTILEQMEYNSHVVEQMERIYWPDGSLKLKRLITGNVESSPPKEPTPPPKRQRAKAKKTALTDISTNAPKLKRRAYKTANQSRRTHASDLCDISKRALATLDPPLPRFVNPRTGHMGYDAANDEEFERRLTSGTISQDRPHAFGVFKDNVALEAVENAGPRACLEKPTAKAEGYPFLPNTHGHQDPNSEAAGFPARRTPFAPLMSSAANPKRVLPNGLPWDHQPGQANSSKASAAKEDTENIEPILDGDGRIDDRISQVYSQRVTQRYFSVTGNQPPQFFSSLPPHMDFGGLTEAKYHGSTLNPLNAYLHQHRRSPQYPPVLFRHPGSSSLTSRQEDASTSGRPVVANDEAGNEA